MSRQCISITQQQMIDDTQVITVRGYQDMCFA